MATASECKLQLEQENMRAFIVCLVVVVSVVSGAPTSPPETEQRSLIAPHAPISPVVPVSTGHAKHHESAFDRGAHEAASSSAQGSLGYDHGAQASKNFVNKESKGSKENYAYSANNAYNQGAGSFSHSGGLNHAAHLTSGLGKHFQQTGGIAGLVPIAPGTVHGFPHLGVPVVPGGVLSSEASKHQQGVLSSGHAQGQGQWSYNQGHSSVNSSGNKETFTNKESSGNESSSAHATGAAQNSHSQNVQAGHHNKGHQVTSVQEGTAVLG